MVQRRVNSMNEEMLFAREDQVIDLSKGTDDTVDFQKFLIFIADDLKLGVVAESVVEILTNQTITYLRLGKPSREDSLVVVLNLDGTQLGILVDAVDQMIDIPKYNILPMPAHNTQLLVSGMCSLPDGSGTMMVLDCEQLMPHD